MKYLIKNIDGFVVERRLGRTSYYGEVLKSAIRKYGISKNPDYGELERIVKRIDTYMESGRFVGEVGAPIYCQLSYHSDVRQIRIEMLKMDRKNMLKEKIREFYKKQIKKIDKAKEDFKWDILSS
ncbi:MAG: hypothetical protein ACFE96_09815 [Candidatus Hermodarchaeota archaeon]